MVSSSDILNMANKHGFPLTEADINEKIKVQKITIDRKKEFIATLYVDKKLDAILAESICQTYIGKPSKTEESARHALTLELLSSLITNLKWNSAQDLQRFLFYAIDFIQKTNANSHTAYMDDCEHYWMTPNICTPDEPNYII